MVVWSSRRTREIDLSKDKMALQRLKELRRRPSASSAPPWRRRSTALRDGRRFGPKHLSLKLSRSRLEQLVEDLLSVHGVPWPSAWKDAGVEPGKIDESWLVGGMTRMPKIQQMVKDFFGRSPTRA